MHEPLVALTDFALFLIAIFCAYTVPASNGGYTRIFQYQFIFLGTAALFGAVFHAFFPLKDTTLGGLMVWLLVCGSIAGTAYTMVFVMTKSLNTSAQKTLRGAFLFLLTFFMLVIVFYKRTYDIVLMFYAPVLLIYFFYACVVARSDKKWKFVVLGLFLSILAGVFQGSGLRIGIFDHNTIYHIVQAVALLVLWYGYSRVIKS